MNVSLSIVGGTSNSFVYDLYNARYVKRTEVAVKEEATLAPPVLEVCIPLPVLPLLPLLRFALHLYLRSLCIPPLLNLSIYVGHGSCS